MDILGCLQFWAIINEAAVTVHEQVFVRICIDIFISLGYVTGSVGVKWHSMCKFKLLINC